MTSASDSASAPLQVLLYSDDVDTRTSVRRAVGSRLAGRDVQWHEIATHDAALFAVDDTTFDLMVLDGEAPKIGGIGLCRQLKNEVFDCPPVAVLIARPQDAWLASWSRADAVAAMPVDPFELPGTLAALVGAQDATVR